MADYLDTLAEFVTDTDTVLLIVLWTLSSARMKGVASTFESELAFRNCTSIGNFPRSMSAATPPAGGLVRSKTRLEDCWCPSP